MAKRKRKSKKTSNSREVTAPSNIKTYSKFGCFGSATIHLIALALMFGHGGSGSGQEGNCEGPKCSSEKQPQGGDDQANGQHRQNENEIPDGKKIQDKPIEVMQVTPEVEEQIKRQENQMALDEAKKKREESARKKALDECKDFFGGIGVTFSQIDGRVSEVHRGYPAEKAGIVVGDEIYALKEGEKIRGEVGTPVVIMVRKEDGSRVQVTLIRDKVCITDEMKEKRKEP